MSRHRTRHRRDARRELVEIADRPHQRRDREEIARVINILDVLLKSTGNSERSVS